MLFKTFRQYLYYNNDVDNEIMLQIIFKNAYANIHHKKTKTRVITQYISVRQVLREAKNEKRGGVC